MLHNTEIQSDTAPLSVNGPQPVWMTLNEARERAFTGEIIFEVDPEVLAYLDHGIVYYAERTSDVSLGRRLLNSGLLDAAQLERGTVCVGDVEHLGRLFERDPSVDRDAVLVVTEASTEELIAEMATHTITTVRATAYRHHPSGVHRWFVAPLDPATVSRPLGALVPLDSIVVDELPELPGVLNGFEELTIEWDEPFDGVDGIESLSEDEFHVSMFEMFADEPPRAERDGGVEEMSPETPTDSLSAPVEDVAVAAEAVDFDFAIRWPDGSDAVGTDDAMSNDDPAPVVDHVVSAPPVFEQIADGEFTFEMPTLTLGDDADASADDVPDDVAEAVRRAIAAIESASAATPTLATPSMTTPLVDSPTMQMFETTPAVANVVADAAPTMNAFAPPTMATSAEVLYARMADETEHDVAPQPVVEQPVPTLGVASVVVVDDNTDSAGSGNERSSALRRLIGGLRRKDR